MRRLFRKAFVTVILALFGYLVYVSVQIGRQSTRDEARPADAILVLGAAEYRGRPSPVLKARLDHALALYKQKMAPILITTGGAGGDPDFTEGGVGRSYLIGHDVPSDAIVVEPEIAASLDRAVAEAHGRLFALPTYTALLELRTLLADRGLAREYWQ